MFVAALLTFFLLALARASPSKRAMVTHEHLKATPQGFKLVGPAPSSTLLTLRMALTNTDIAGLERAATAVSTPGSPNYGQHLSKEEVEAYLRPTAATSAAVTDWLAENGVTAKPISSAGDWIEITVPVSKANSLFDTTFSVFSQPQSNTQNIRTLAYSLPAALQSAIVVVHPTTSFWDPFSGNPKVTIAEPPTVRHRLTRQNIPASCASNITPTCLQDLYGIPTSPATQPGNGIAVSGFGGQFASQDDLTEFLTVNRPDIANATFGLQTLDGGSNPQTANSGGIEADLDIQYTVGVATGVPVTFVSVGPNITDGLFGFIDIVNFLLAEPTTPPVFTTSYGGIATETLFSPALVATVCNGYMSLGARGTSVLFASGDTGVETLLNEIFFGCTVFQPTFPPGCPWVTAVGASSGVPETAASFSSGGFSNVFPIPDYQAEAVEAYKAGIGSLYDGLYNTTGRGFPDVSALGVDVLITLDGNATLVDGTSCSSPIFASIVALLNDQLLAANKPMLGFLNPFIYANADAFSDVTSGSNPGCGTSGFPATAGWDPVTGVGTPNFAKLLKAVGL